MEFKVGDTKEMYCPYCKTNREFELFNIIEKRRRNGIKINYCWTCENEDCLDTLYTTEIK